MAAGAVINGKVVAITGWARGIGLATATALHRLGAKVAIGDIDEVAVKEAGTELGLDVYAKLDVNDRASFEAFLDEVERQLGPLDVLINNSGICPTGNAVEESDQITSRTIAVRLELRGTGVEFSSVMPTLTNTAMVDGVSSARGLRNASSARTSLLRGSRRRQAQGLRGTGPAHLAGRFQLQGAAGALPVSDLEHEAQHQHRQQRDPRARRTGVDGVAEQQ
jgi:NAD(P)-dependent dehydrogenase (short-subunit alcohol dehydrogenase family)